VVTLVAVVDGRLSLGDKLVSSVTGQEYEANEVGGWVRRMDEVDGWVNGGFLALCP